MLHPQSAALEELGNLVGEIIADKKASLAGTALRPQAFRPTQPLLPYAEHDLYVHRQRNLHRPWFTHRGGLHWLRLGRLTLSWSWRRL